MYALIRKCLFALDPERAHAVALQSLQWANRLHLTPLIAPRVQNKPVTLMGLTFPNRLGFAAGLDKSADYVDALAALQVGFIEIGSITPKPQLGNPKPRLFRLIDDNAIINRMGFNNKGVDYVKTKLSKMHYRGILGINLGKNKETPLEHAANDYLIGMRALWPFASYFTINISSPNTPGLRELQQKNYLTTLLRTLKQEQKNMTETEHKYVPLVVKIAPDLSDEELTQMAQVFLQEKVDGVIATNTTLAHEHWEAGGLSGKPLCAMSTHVISTLYSSLQDQIPIIASGGVMDIPSYHEKRRAGAALVQIYTGFIYQGPALIRELLAAK